MNQSCHQLAQEIIKTESLQVIGNGMKMQATFHSDAAKLWNIVPGSVKNCNTLFSVKREIKKFVLTLPI